MKCMDKHEFEQQNVFGTGAANTAYAKFFIGQSFLNPLTDPKTGLFLAGPVKIYAQNCLQAPAE